jgi:dTDP-4-amino-4,6-dideoxygalactose transaminase
MELSISKIHAALYLANNLPEYLFPKSPLVTCLGAQTLDLDDVQIAKSWLKNCNDWYDPEIVVRFETEFARWNGSEYAYAFMGGRVALSACIYALDLKPGDEVILPGYTCVVVPNAFKYAGIKTVYSDIELDTYGLDVQQLKTKVTPNTRAILLQHLYGLVCRDYEEILEFAQHHNLKVIEDCAHATGAVYKGIKVGNRGDVAFYSSNRSKVFYTVEGGIAVTNDEAISDRLKTFYNSAAFPNRDLINKLLHNVFLDYYSFKHRQRSVFKTWIWMQYGDKYYVSTSDEEQSGGCPPNYIAKLPAPLAALGLNQLKKIDSYNNLRRQTAKQWDAWCERNYYRKPIVITDSTPAFLRYPVLMEPEKKADISWAAKELRVELGVWFVSNLHPAKFVVLGCPNADMAVKQCVNLPGVCLDVNASRQ